MKNSWYFSFFFSQFFYLLWSHRSCVHTATAALRSSSFLVAGLRPKTLGKMKTCVWDGLSTNLFTVCMCVRTDYYKLHILTWAQCYKIVHLRHLWNTFSQGVSHLLFSLVVFTYKIFWGCYIVNFAERTWKFINHENF